MSRDRSLRGGDALRRQRSVLRRIERITRLSDEGKWQKGMSVFGLPKVRVRIVKKAKAPAKKAQGTEGDGPVDTAETAETAEKTES